MARSRVCRELLTVVALLVATLLATSSAMATVSKVYWTDRDNATLSATDLISGATQVLADNFARLQDVDLDTSTGILYFADWGPFIGNSGSINRVNKDGTGLATVLNTRDAVHQLALDQALQRIYFTRAVSYDNHEISHVTTGGAAYTVLLMGGPGFFDGPGWFPSGLAVDPVNSLLYWGDIGVIFNPPNGSVNRMGTGGSAPTQLTPHVTGRGRGYALDQASQTIFLTAHDPMSAGTGGGLFSYDIATNTETQLISDPGTGYWDIEIDPVGQRIWWTDYGRGEIRSAMFDGSDVQVELSNLTNPYGLALEIGPPPGPTSIEVTKTASFDGHFVSGTISITNVGENPAVISGIEDTLEVHFPKVGKSDPPPLPEGSTPNWFEVADVPVAAPGVIEVGETVEIDYSLDLCRAEDFQGANAMRNVVAVTLANKPEKARKDTVVTRSESFEPQLTDDCVSAEFSETFPPSDRSAEWDDFEAQLSADTVYSQIQFFSDTDPGFTCTGPPADTICQAIRMQTNEACISAPLINVICDGNLWSVGVCGGTELSVNTPICACTVGTSIRAEIDDACSGNPNVYGAVNGNTCSSATTTMTVRCE